MPSGWRSSRSVCKPPISPVSGYPGAGYRAQGIVIDLLDTLAHLICQRYTTPSLSTKTTHRQRQGIIGSEYSQSPMYCVIPFPAMEIIIPWAGATRACRHSSMTVKYFNIRFISGTFRYPKIRNAPHGSISQHDIFSTAISVSLFAVLCV